MQLKKLVDYINSTIDAALAPSDRFAGSEFDGIAVTMPRQDEDGNIENFPVIIDTKGEADYLGVDDEFPLRIYHKNNGTTYAPAQNVVGPANNILKGTANMSMIVTGFRDKLKLTPEELNEVILQALPSRMPQADAKALNVQSVIIAPGSTDFNFMNVFNREYKIKDLKALPGEIMMIELKYVITCTFDKSCINILSNS
jgi:hypothetical protein